MEHAPESLAQCHVIGRLDAVIMENASLSPVPALRGAIEYPPTIFSTARHHLRKTHLTKHPYLSIHPPATPAPPSKMAESNPNDAQVSAVPYPPRLERGARKHQQEQEHGHALQPRDKC